MPDSPRRAMVFLLCCRLRRAGRTPTRCRHMKGVGAWLVGRIRIDFGIGKKPAAWSACA